MNDHNTNLELTQNNLSNGGSRFANAASKYASQYGWHVFPAKGKIPLTPNGHLNATNDQSEIQKLWELYPNANNAVALKPSGCVVLDLDTKPGINAHDTLVELQFKYGAIEAPCVHTAGGGYHFYFKTDKPFPRKIGVMPGVDILGDGYAILPPSIGTNGQRYEWDADLHISLIPLPPVPHWLVDLSGQELTAQNNHGNDYWSELFGEEIPEGKRNETLAKVIGHLLRRYVSPTLALRTLQAINKVHCRPPLPQSEVEQIFTSIANREFLRRQQHPRQRGA